ncbi:MAG TPA: right-handed parallel beta-helix repeat-containing protein [Allosphingosinicella sp.]
MRRNLFPKLALVLMAVAAMAPLSAQPGGPFTVAETGESFSRLRDAVRAIGGGEGTIRIAPGRYRDCVVQEAGRIAYVAQQPGTAVFEGGMCEGKAVLVLRGEAAHVEGLVFTRMAVEDGNGAGIRIEQGDLSVSQSLFIDGQSGILSAADPEGSIAIDRSTFSGLGRDPDGDGAHSVYIGRYGSLRVTNSRFERGTGGHYLKSRAPRIEVLDCSFDDSAGRNTNYLIDLPEGAMGRIAGNIFLNGTGKDNYSTMIAVAAEGAEQPSEGLVVEQNEVALAPGFRWSTTFVGNWSGERLTVRNNHLRGRITMMEAR